MEFPNFDFSNYYIQNKILSKTTLGFDDQNKLPTLKRDGRHNANNKKHFTALHSLLCSECKNYNLGNDMIFLTTYIQ